MSNPPVLYLGDTNLSGGASYLAGLMAHWGFGFDYLPSDQRADAALIRTPRKLFVLSDYPAAMMDTDVQRQLLDQVAHGAGLVMIGGWESFRGLSGCWNDTPLASALPVRIASQDDRVNCDQTALVIQRQEHPITDNLPWSDRPPAIGGFNRLGLKPDSIVVLEVQRFRLRLTNGSVGFEPDGRNPLLTTGAHYLGRTVALATDLAPHWVGPWVDWGNGRVAAQADGSCPIEVGSAYAQFVRQLLNWVGRLDAS